MIERVESMALRSFLRAAGQAHFELGLTLFEAIHAIHLTFTTVYQHIDTLQGSRLWLTDSSNFVLAGL